MNIKSWGQALNTMPKLSPEEWQRLDIVSRWLVATRASVFFMTFMSAALGGLLAARESDFDWQAWLVCALGLIFAHATNNLVNDYTDDGCVIAPKAPETCGKESIRGFWEAVIASNPKNVEIITQKAKENSEVVKAHSNEVNIGKGAAIRRGILHVTGDIVLIQGSS